MKPAAERARRVARRWFRGGVASAVCAVGVSSGVSAQCVSAWENAATNSPGARQQAAVVYDSARGRVVLFGGFDPVGRKGDTWAFDGTAWTRLTADGPSARAGHAMAYDSGRDRVVLFGGFNGASLGDTWEFDGAMWALRTEEGAPARTEHAMAYDPVRARTVLLGGEVDGEQTWEWDGLAWQSMGIPGPPARVGHAMVFDSARSRVVMALGRGPTGLRNGTWAYDGLEWRQIAASGPSPRFYHAMSYDSVRDRLVLFGGTSSGITGLSDTWEFNGMTWSLTPAMDTPPRFGAAGVFDAARGASLVVGGSASSGNITGETWKWWPAMAPMVIEQPASLTVAAGEVAQFDVLAVGSPTLGYQWSLNGSAMQDGPGAVGIVVGAHSPHLQIQSTTMLAQGTYQCVVANGCGMAASNPAELVVHVGCPADVDDGSGSGTPDGGVTVDDLLFFFTVFGAGDPRADVDDGSGTGTPDGGVTVDDMLYFLLRYNAGC